MSVQRILVLLAAISATFLLGGRGWQEPAQAAQSEGSNRGGSESVTLRIAGDEGTPFSGVCSVGEEQHDISGQTPKSFDYDLNDRRLTCEIRKQGARDAGLTTVLEGENTRAVHRSVGGEDAVIRLTYQDGNVSSMSSSSSQTTSGADGGGSSSSADNEPKRRGDGPESLADRIQKKVGKILERILL